jgi:hypothetical protein
MRRKRPMFVALAVAAAALAVAATASGGSKTSGPSGVGSGKMIGSGGGFGEVFKAPSGTLAHALFHANLLPSNKAGRNIALASFGRSTKKVN